MKTHIFNGVKPLNILMKTFNKTLMEMIKTKGNERNQIHLVHEFNFEINLVGCGSCDFSIRISLN